MFREFLPAPKPEITCRLHRNWLTRHGACDYGLEPEAERSVRDESRIL